MRVPPSQSSSGPQSADLKSTEKPPAEDRTAKSVKLKSDQSGWVASGGGAAKKATTSPQTERVDRAAVQARGPTLSPIGQQIVQRLQAKHAGLKGKNWDVSYGNRLSGEWLMATPSKDKSAVLAQNVREVITNAKSSVTFSTFAEPDGTYQKVIGDSLKELNAKLPANSPGVDVRILIGQIGDRSPKQVLDDLTQGLPPDSKVRVTVATYGANSSFWSYNHSKILSRDGQDAVVGGHNWWAGDYNEGNNPVHDISMRARGDAARHAENYFNELWNYAAKDPSKMASKGQLRGPIVPPGPEAGPPADGGSPIISVGTQGNTYWTDKATSDDAIYAMMDAAQKSIKLSQQDLVSMKLPEKHLLGIKLPSERLPQTKQHISSELMDHIGRAMIDRKVKVDIALSTSDEAGYQHGWSLEKTRETILAHVEKMAKGRSPAEIAEIKARLEVRGVRTPDGGVSRNHAKAIMVDDSAFYIGSQNLYPGGMAERHATAAFSQLAEFGYIVDDPKKAQQMKEQYWDRLWSSSK